MVQQNKSRVLHFHFLFIIEISLLHSVFTIGIQLKKLCTYFLYYIHLGKKFPTRKLRAHFPIDDDEACSQKQDFFHCDQ